MRAVAGFDATFSVPKSLSVWWALTGDAGLLDAHELAVTATLAHLERFGATTRVRVDGRRLHPDTAGLTVATFRQTTSRADDPQVHTHAVISAKVQTDDGRWLALDARYLKRHQRMLGGLYQSVLRAELTHRYGVAWEAIVNGQAEIAGLPGSCSTCSPNAPVRSTTPWPARSVSSDGARDGTRRPGNAPRCPGKHQPTPGRKTARCRGSADTVGGEARARLDGAGSRRLAAGVTGAAMVTVEEVIDRLSVGFDVDRADVLRAICDLQPRVRVGTRWARPQRAATG